MSKNRLEAFSDGVIAIIITIMVLELKTPHGAELSDLSPLWPVALSYILSFIYVGIYWNNHHHLFQSVSEITGPVLWANMHLLFWLSLTPFITGWAGENHFAPMPVAFYGFVLLMCGVAYYILTQALLRADPSNLRLAKALGQDFKGKISVVLYAIAIPLAMVNAFLSLGFYVAVAMIWFVPDRRFEKSEIKKA